MDESKKQLPSSLVPLWDDLQSEVIWLHARWTMYRQLYAESQQRIDLLNDTAAHFFSSLRRILLDDAVLGLSRLTDSLGNQHQSNAVLEQLLRHADVQADAALVSDLEPLFAAVADACAPFRTIRNKRIAHRDLHVALALTTNPLPGMSRQMVEDALAAIRAFMNRIESHFTGAETVYQYLISSSDGESLIAYLKLGVAYEDAEREDLIPWDYAVTARHHEA